MRLRNLPLLTLLFLLPTVVKAGPIEKIAELFKKGSASEIAAYFSANLDIIVMNEANTYAKAQAEMLLDKFFKEHKPHTVKILHRISSNANYNYAVILLATDKGKFRITYTMKEVGNAMEIIEMRIESEKT
jgi:hypothetical protein